MKAKEIKEMPILLNEFPALFYKLAFGMFIASIGMDSVFSFYDEYIGVFEQMIMDSNGEGINDFKDWEAFKR
jgi:hypothetical protein